METSGPSRPSRRPYRQPQEWKLISLRECPVLDEMHMCDTPAKAVAYWHQHIVTAPHFTPDCECMVVLMLNTRRRIHGHQLVSIGTIDTLLVTPLSVFRTAIVANSAAIILCHNHPSSDPTPSEADIKVTRDLVRAGQLLKIEVLDHIVIGHPEFRSLRELGYLSV